MKISNRPNIIKINLLTIGFCALSVLMYVVCRVLEIAEHTPVGYLLLVLFFFNLLLLVFAIQRQMVFEFENSGAVICIRRYAWFSSGKSMVSPVFEMPCGKIKKVKIRPVLYQQYLEIYFISDRGKSVKTRINMTGCTKMQSLALLKSLQNDTVKDYKETEGLIKESGFR